MIEMPPAPDEEFEDRARKLRPFYFIVVVWGERYTNFLCDLCIASLLAPGNIPSLKNRGNKFLIATTDEAWERIQRKPLFQMLKLYVEPVNIPIPPCPGDVSACVHMGIGHKLATHIAHEDRAYAVLLTPDLMLSDGTIAAAQRHAVRGMHVVLAAALRFGEEPLFKAMDELGITGPNLRFSGDTRPIAVSGRQLVKAGIRSFHSETLRYCWDAPYFSESPVACWWPVEAGDGILVHCLSWAPLLVDYDAVIHHDSSMLDDWTIDGDYVYRNYGFEGRVHVVQDSDEMMLVSWAPLADREQSLEPRASFALPVIGEWSKGALLQSVYCSPVFDPLKRKIFFLPVRWHAGELGPSWLAAERRAAETLKRYIGAPLSSRPPIRVRAVRSSVSYVTPLSFLANRYWRLRKDIPELLASAWRGDSNARYRIRRAWRNLLLQVFGIPMPAELLLPPPPRPGDLEGRDDLRPRR